MGDFFKKKHPKSKSGFRCLGPCNKPGEWIIHPITLEYVVNKDHPFCPVNEWVDDNGEKKSVDQCYNVSNKSAKDMSVVVPDVRFSTEQFLKLYYKLFSFEQVIQWAEDNKNLPYKTMKRILDCALDSDVYLDEFDVLDDRTMDVFIRIAKTHWIKDIYNRTSKYINVLNSKISLKRNKLSPEDNKVERMNFLINKFINYNHMSKFITGYLDKHKSRWDDTQSHMSAMKEEFEQYIVRKIKDTIKN